MSSLNKVFLMGNLTRDPEVRQVGSNNSVCTFGLAVNRRFSTAQGEEREETCFVDIETWGKQAETCGRYLRKGAPALIEGRLRLDRWEDRQSGEARSRLLVRAERVQFMSAPERSSEDSSSGDRAPVPQRPAARHDRDNQAPAREIPDFEPIEPSDDDIPF
jgi:single-strand DNA-binding protein